MYHNYTTRPHIQENMHPELVKDCEMLEYYEDLSFLFLCITFMK